jgi:hypothetical protein
VINGTDQLHGSSSSRSSSASSQVPSTLCVLL